jgi:GNAT superfamily N-acetyltransferase
MDLAIRCARLPDVPRLLELYKLLDVAPEPEMPIEGARARFLDLASNPQHRIFVAGLDKQIVGTFAMVFVSGISHGARDSCVIEDVVVAPEMQGKGIGVRMMRFAMDRCAQRRCYKVALSSHLRREQAHRFYERLGFAKHGYSFLVA